MNTLPEGWTAEHRACGCVVAWSPQREQAGWTWRDSRVVTVCAACEKTRAENVARMDRVQAAMKASLSGWEQRLLASIR